MKTISVINRKGGVGKSVTAQALGAGLMKKGYKVLFIDLDSQANLTYGMGASFDGYSSMDILQGIKASDAIQHTAQGDIIAGSEQLATADADINGKDKEYRLKRALDGLNYDYAIIDTPAALGTLTINALTASYGVIIPVQAEIYSLQGIGLLNRAIEAVKEHSNKNLSILGVLITRFDKRSILSRDMQANINDVAKELKTRLYSTPIRECISVKEAQACQQDIFTYAPKSNAAKDYSAFIDEFLTQ